MSSSIQPLLAWTVPGVAGTCSTLWPRGANRTSSSAFSISESVKSTGSIWRVCRASSRSCLSWASFFFLALLAAELTIYYNNCLYLCSLSFEQKKKKKKFHVFHPRLTAADPGHLAPIVVGRRDKIQEIVQKPRVGHLLIQVSECPVVQLLYVIRSHYVRENTRETVDS